MSERPIPRVRANLAVVFDGLGGNDGKPTIIPVNPRSATVCLNGYKEADTWEMEFDARDLPLTPEAIRSAAVSIFFYQEEGMLENRTDWAQSEPTIAGVVDNASVHYGSDGATFRVDGRDLTALLIDRQWPPEKTVPVGLPLDQVVQSLLDDAANQNFINPDTGKPIQITSKPLRVEYRSEQPDPTVDARTGRDPRLTHKTVKLDKKGNLRREVAGAARGANLDRFQSPRTGKGHGRSTKGGIPFKSGENYWDVIYKLCLRHGLIAFVQGSKVVIGDPKVLTQQSARSAYRMVYGRNVQDLSVERHIGREAVPTIVVTGRDPRTRRAIEVRYPQKVKPKQTGLGTAKVEERRYTLPGVIDPASLFEYARTIYHSIARTEARMRLATIDLRDLRDAQGAQNDLLRIRAGDAIALGFDVFNREVVQKLGPEDRYKHLRSLGYTDVVSRLIAYHLEQIKLLAQFWYVRTATLSFDVSDGVHVEVEGVAFVSPPRDNAA